MPQLRQPADLVQEPCLVQLGANAAQYCYEQAVNNAVSLNNYIDTIRRSCLGLCVPTFYSDYFCRSFFEGFHIISETLSKDTLVRYKQLALEMIMNLGVARSLNGTDARALLAVLNPHEAGRLEGLRILDLSDVPDDLSIDLNKFDLSNVVVFIYPKNCTFKHLQVIGNKCLNLEVLIVRDSPNVTDPGLRALNLCSKLRHVDISGCSKVTRKGINVFLASHENVAEFHGWIQSQDELTILSHPNGVVYNNIKCFDLKSRFLTNAFMRIIVDVFPNLITLRLSGCRIEDLRLLENFHKLEKLEFSVDCRFDLDHLKQLLSLIGRRITCLKMPCIEEDNHLKQIDLCDILTSCPNIENLTFAYMPVRARETLTVPSLGKLKTLKCRLQPRFQRRTVKVELAAMPELISFAFTGFKNTSEDIERMIFDESNLPELKVLSMDFNNYEWLYYFKRIVRENNIDLTINDFFVQRSDHPW